MIPAVCKYHVFVIHMSCLPLILWLGQDLVKYIFSPNYGCSGLCKVQIGNVCVCRDGYSIMNMYLNQEIWELWKYILTLEEIDFCWLDRGPSITWAGAGLILTLGVVCRDDPDLMGPMLTCHRTQWCLQSDIIPKNSSLTINSPVTVTLHLPIRYN